MAIHRMLQSMAFGPEDVKAVTTAYEAVLIELGLNDREDPITDIVARRIISCCKADGCNPDALRDQVLRDLRELPAKPPLRDGSE